ncbi:caspase a-like [Xenentodon cancila]
MINELLDNLHGDGVFSMGEKDAILESNATTRDKARVFIDGVINKGSTSCLKLITHIQNEDPTLYSELSLSDVQVNETDAPSVTKTSTAPFSIKSFWESKQNDPEVYNVTKDSYKNRIALLITNMTFSNKRMNREGAEVDHGNMKKMLTNLGYEVVTYTNLTGQAINEAFTKFAQHPKLKKTDSVIVVIMSHGRLGAVLGVNWYPSDKNSDEFPINSIYTHLGSENCPALVDKPKIIIIQACRGGDVYLYTKLQLHLASFYFINIKNLFVLERDGSVLVSDSVHQPATEVGWEDDAIRNVHKEKDFISLLSCTPDTVSYRHPVSGSLLIQYFIDQCDTSGNQDHIQELFRKVMLRFESFKSEDKRQMATVDRTTLIRHFYFFPGI